MVKKMNIISTIVGSFPTKSYKPQSFNERLIHRLGLFDSYRQSIENCVESFVRNDVNIICDGQVREDMVKIFTDKINGFRNIDNTSHIKGKITPAAHPISVKDLQIAFRKAKSLDSKFKLNAPLNEIYTNDAKGVKGIITGPTTIIHSSIIDRFYNTKVSAIYDVAKALTIEARALEKAGACAIQIDEPFISTGAEDICVSKKAVEIISSNINIPVILHVCGDLTDVLGDLLDFNVDILDLEFAGMADNIKTLKHEWDDTYDKQIGIGCINTRSEDVDSTEVVRKTVKDVTDIIEKDEIIIDPDCGMRMLPLEVADKKLGVINKIKEEGI